MAPTTITPGCVPSISYKLTLGDGEVIDQSDESGLEYLHGHHNIVPGLEEELEGKAIGDTLQVKVSPEKGYGVRDEKGVRVIERSSFPEEGQLAVGNSFIAEDSDGEAAPFWIVGVEDNEVTVDFNHPLAGRELHFEVAVLAIREATDEERQHGHPHAGDCGHDH